LPPDTLFLPYPKKLPMNNNLPKGHQQLMPYLLLTDAAGFIEFTAEVLDAQEQYRQMDEDDRIRHAEIRIGGSTIMVADCTEAWPPQTSGLFVYVADVDATYEQALNAGAESVMPPTDKDYGRSCGVLDPFGNTWWITSPPAHIS
jgi:PhnB protein